MDTWSWHFHFIWISSVSLKVNYCIESIISLNCSLCSVIFHLTFGSVILMPTRKTSSPMKRLRQRFLWMVLRSLCRPLKKQKVKRLMAKQTSDTAIPILVMTVSRSSWTLPSPYRELNTYRLTFIYTLVTMIGNIKA